jgi:general transcription factor 3C polypeptide 1
VGSDFYFLFTLYIFNNYKQHVIILVQDEKFILRGELYKWLVSLEKDKCTTTDRKTIDRILNKLQQQGHCKCIHINAPVVTNFGRSRITQVVLHPSIEGLSPELLGEIHDRHRSFEMQSRGQGSSRGKNEGLVPVLKGVQRTENHVGSDVQAVRSEAMRANGFILAKMVRAKLLHCFLWDYLSSSAGSSDASSSEKHVYELNNPQSSCKLFSLEAAIKAIPVELFLQVVGSIQKFDDMIEKCKRRLLLSDLPIQEYKHLMDTHATGRLSLVIDILLRLKV